MAPHGPPCWWVLRSAGLVALWLAASVTPAAAVSIELKDAGPDRVERQRAAAEGRLPLPDTPDTSRLAERLAAQGFNAGSPLFIRIFKAQSELEVWIEQNGSYAHFATYPICHWSGGLGPKLRQGDKQSPEGFYSLTERNLHRAGRWQQALNLGYPNAFDRSQARDGSYILVHGGCSSVGCFAMTNPVMSEIYGLTRAAFAGGQRHIPVHVFPFRMTEQNLEQYKSSEWINFWLNLKEGYDAFEDTKRPPRISVCQNRYSIQQSSPLETGGPGPLGVCGETASLIEGLDRLEGLMPPQGMARLWAGVATSASLSSGATAASLRTLLLPAQGPVQGTAANFNVPKQRQSQARSYTCNPSLPACRKHIALQDVRFAKRTWATNISGPRAKSPARSRYSRI